jgi:alpha-L-fucosidase
MKSSTAALLIFCFLVLFGTGCRNQSVSEPENNISVQDSEGRHLDWFREAKFGMFIHWGPYSSLAGEYNGRQVPVGENAEWIMKKLTIPVNEYRELARKMNPVKFDADEWVKLAKDAGMKYIVITAKHHDGFAMYHSNVTKYNIVDWTSFGRDPLKELSQACAEQGIRFCFYYSHREDWDHPGGYGNNWDYDNDWGSDLYDRGKFENYLEEKARPQLRELLTNYGPIGLVWFDRGMYTPEQGREFVRLVHELQPSTLINGRVGHYDQEFLGDYQSMGDNGMPPGGLEEYWETPMTLNDTWGYSRYDTLWKSPETVILRLVEIASRGGNFLLNIGPKGDGEIPEATIRILKKVGPWINRNAESIYGTTANPFGELPWGYCTVKDNKLYLFVRDWPQNSILTLSGLKNKVTSAYLLKDRSTVLSVTREEEQTKIRLPSEAPDNLMSVLVLELDGTPLVTPSVVLQDEKGSVELNYLTVRTSGKTLTRFNRKGGFHISKWTGPEDFAEWSVRIDNPGKFRVNITYAANKEWEGKQYEIAAGDSLIRKSVVHTGDWYEYHEFPAGYFEIAEAGEIRLTIKPAEQSNTYLMYLKSIRLDPVQDLKKNGWSTNQELQ